MSSIDQGKNDDAQRGKFDDTNYLRRMNVKSFLERFPGMLPYYIGDPLKQKGRISSSHLQSPDTKFCTLVVLLLLILFTSISIFMRRDINEMFFTQIFVED